MNINFVKNINEVKLNKNDSFLLIGKSKDLKQVEYSHLNSVLKDLQIPESVIFVFHTFDSKFALKLEVFASLKVVYRVN